MKASKKLNIGAESYTKEPRPGMLVSLTNRRAAYVSVEDERRGNSLAQRIIDPKHIVLFLENIPSSEKSEKSGFSYDKILFEEKVFYILNDYPRTERWVEVK